MRRRGLSRTLVLVIAAPFALGSAMLACSSESTPESRFRSGERGAGRADDDAGGAFLAADAKDCVGLDCQKAACDAGAKTRVRGTVFDPAGKVPLYNVIVYVPNGELAPLSSGASCDRCGGTVSGKPIAIALTDSKGDFVLDDVPAGGDIPLVMQVGKWRRKITLPRVEPCAETHADPAVTRLPRNHGEGDIPRIAITTGGADPLECLLRKIGIDDSEFSVAGGQGRVHLYAGYGYGSPTIKTGASRFVAGPTFTQAKPFWSDASSLKAYDLVMLACEGQPNEETKPKPARDALYEYAKAGGRVFASHWHSYWFSAPDSPPDVRATGTWSDRQDPPNPAYASLQTGFPKGAALKEWLSSVGGLTDGGLLEIKEAKHNLDAVNAGTAQSWITVPNTSVASSPTAIQYVTFNTPVGAAQEAQCGRVVFSDLHVSSGDHVGEPFPSGCVTRELSAQEKALEFMLFDLSSCVQSDSEAPRPR